MRREMIKVASVVDAKILNPDETSGIKIGYLRITEFTEPTARELSQKLNSLQAAGMQALINGSDMRNDQITIIANKKLRRATHRVIAFIAAINTSQHPKTVASLGPQVLQGLADRHFLPVRKL